jgi:hypothetical protein
MYISRYKCASISISIERFTMKFNKLAAVTMAEAALVSGEASAKGCLTGAAVGGTAGHFAGGHSLIGAGVGCAIGRHRANKKDKEAATAPAANQQVATNETQTLPPARTIPTK